MKEHSSAEQASTMSKTETAPTIRLFKVNMDAAASEAAADVLQSGYVGQGPRVEAFETAFQECAGTSSKPLFLNSCTSAITLALALAEVGPGDEVISTPMTCLATNLPILHRFAKPIWADIDRFTGLIDPLDVERKITARTKAIIAVDWAGRQCDYGELTKFGIPVIQDAAHCLEISRPHGNYVAWSFQAIKFLTTVDGGALLTPADQYERAKLMRWFGLDRTQGESFRCSQNVTLPGFKFQPNDLAAAIGLANLTRAANAVDQARSNANFLTESLTGLSGVVLPPDDPKCSWWIYTLLVPGNRDAFIAYLKDRGIEASPVHSRNDHHDIFKNSLDDCLPGVDHFATNEVAIPNGWWLTNQHLEQVAGAVKDFFKTGG